MVIFHDALILFRTLNHNLIHTNTLNTHKFMFTIKHFKKTHLNILPMKIDFAVDQKGKTMFEKYLSQFRTICL